MSPAVWILVVALAVCALSGLLIARLMRLTDAPPANSGAKASGSWPDVERRRRPRNPN